MKKKKIMSVVVASCLMVSLFAMPAMACGGHHGRGRTQTQANYITYTTCSVEGCNLTDSHYHDGQYYYGHYWNDGHDYHELCGVQGCTNTGVHYHGENCYYGCGNSGYGYCH